MSKLAAALIAVAFFVFALLGLLTGDLSSHRTPHLDRVNNPVFFWAYIGGFVAVGVFAALVALGVAKMKPPREITTDEIKRDAAEKLAFLALLSSAGSAYAWWTERSLVSPTTMNEIMGWCAIGALGIAALPPVLPPSPVRTALRVAGAAAVLLAALMIFRLTR